MADQKIELEIVMDDGSVKRAFANIKKEADDTGGKFGNAFKVNGLTDFAAGLFLVNKALQAVKATAEALVDTVLSGEKIEAINKRFAILAQQQQVNADALALSISRAVDGTVDMEDALEATSKSLINLQTGISEIPKLFELARKTSATFGGDTVSNFEAIQQAIISGNTRVLRQVGLFIDAGDAVKSYAKSIGAAEDGLSEAGKQQAILNAVLQSGEERFKNINTAITPAEQSLKRFGVSFGEVGDTVSLAANKAFGPSLASFFTRASTLLDLFNIKMGEFLLNKTPEAADKVKLLTNEISILNTQIEQQSRLANQEDFIAILQQNLATKKEQLLIEQQLANQSATQAALDLQTQANKQIEHAQILEITDAMREQFAVMDAYEKQRKELVESEKNAAQQINNAIKNAIVNGIANSIQAMTNALVRGENAIESIGKALLVLFADLAIEVGKILLATGIGMLSLKFLDPTGAIAAGIGLIALGSLLKSVIGAGESPSTASTGTQGNVSFGGGFEPIEQNRPEEIRDVQGTTVNLTIQGDVLDSDSTGMRIVELLNGAIDTKGAIVRTV